MPGLPSFPGLPAGPWKKEFILIFYLFNYQIFNKRYTFITILLENETKLKNSKREQFKNRNNAQVSWFNRFIPGVRLKMTFF